MTTLIAPEIDRYVYDHTRAQPALFDDLRRVTRERMEYPQMQVGRVEGILLKTLVALMRARRVIEIGTFTGYSALSMAEALPDDGELITCDKDPHATGIAREFFDKSPHGKKITIKLGDALETVRGLPFSQPFDLAFIDADKDRYVEYYDALVPLIRPNGLIVADNTLWGGAVVDPKDASDKAIAALNDRVNSDPRVENVLLSVRDGMMLARKL